MTGMACKARGYESACNSSLQLVGAAHANNCVPTFPSANFVLKSIPGMSLAQIEEDEDSDARKSCPKSVPSTSMAL
jgi:hypothetical protein